MTGEVIKSFLVGLGFEVDDASWNKFTKSIASATLRVTALYGSIQALAAGVFYSISKVSESFEDLGYQYRIIAPAINKALVLRQALLSAYRSAGINIRQAVVESVKFNMSLARTKFALDAVYKSVGVKFLPLLTKQMDIFRQKIYQNMPKIQAALEGFVKVVFKAFDSTVQLGGRLFEILERIYQFFVDLDQRTNHWSTIILGVVAAWKLLNLEFLATPLGLLLAGLVGILALYDDFKVWEKGGKSFFDWSPFIPVINAVKGAITGVKEEFFAMIEVVKAVFQIFVRLFHGDWSGAFDALKNAGQKVLDLFSSLLNVMTSILGVSEKFGTFILDRIAKLFGGTTFDAAVSNALGVTGQAAGAQSGGVQPLGTSVANTKSTNLHVNQQTQITVSGAADAQGTGRAVSSQQDRVNFDLVRNMRGATR